MKLPPTSLRKCGNFFHRDDYWTGSGMREAERLRDHLGLTASARVLDVGCGAGRLCTGLLETRLPFRKYVGVDVIPQSVDWCLANLAQPPRIDFVRLDIHNARYNPTGAIKMDHDFKLPFADASFEIIYAWSLFTHLLLDDSCTYLREFARLLAPGGRIWFTAFAEYGVQEVEENPPGYPPGKIDQGPLHRVRFDVQTLVEAIGEAGLVVETFNHHCEWNWQSAFLLRGMDD